MTAVSTEARIADRSTGQDGRVRSCHAPRPAPGLELSFQKRVGHRQLSDLGMQVPNLILVDDRRLAAAAPKDTRRPVQQCAFHWLIIVECTPSRLAGSDTVASPFSASSATFALNPGACCFRFDIFDLLRGEDQQTASQSLRQCPGFRGHLTGSSIWSLMPKLLQTSSWRGDRIGRPTVLSISVTAWIGLSRQRQLLRMDLSPPLASLWDCWRTEKHPKKAQPEEIVAKLRHNGVLVSQGRFCGGGGTTDQCVAVRLRPVAQGAWQRSDGRSG